MTGNITVTDNENRVFHTFLAERKAQLCSAQMAVASSGFKQKSDVLDVGIKLGDNFSVVTLGTPPAVQILMKPVVLFWIWRDIISGLENLKQKLKTKEFLKFTAQN